MRIEEIKAVWAVVHAAATVVADNKSMGYDIDAFDDHVDLRELEAALDALDKLAVERQEGKNE